MSYYEKYFKYKSKYLNLQQQIGGAGELKLYFLDKSALTKALEEDTRLLNKLKENKINIEKYIETLKKIKEFKIPSASQTGGINLNPFGKDPLKSIEKASKKEEKAKQKLDKKMEKKIEMITTETKKQVDKIGSKLEKLSELLNETDVNVTKCNLLYNGLPLYTGLTLTEKFTFKLDDFAPCVVYGKNMKLKGKNIGSNMTTDITGDYGENYENFISIIKDFEKLQYNVEYIVLVKEIVGGKDILICCFEYNIDKINIVDPIKFKNEKLKTYAVTGITIKKEIHRKLSENINLFDGDNREYIEKLIK